MSARTPLTRLQKVVLGVAFAPMLATGVAGGVGTYSNISGAYGAGTALGAVAAGEGATAVLALVLLGLTMLGQASPLVVRIGLWALPAAASVMAFTAADDPGKAVIYAVTPMGMCVSAEGMAFLARRIVVHTDGRDAEAERRAAAIVQALAYHRARAANHPDKKARTRSDKVSWRLARKVGAGDVSLGDRLLEVQRDRVTAGANAALADMLCVTPGPDAPRSIEPAHAEESEQIKRNRSTSDLGKSTPSPAPAVVNVKPIPRAVQVGFFKPLIPVKPMPPVAPAMPVVSIDRPDRVDAAASTRPRRATGRVPDVARSTRPRRTDAELLTEARKETAKWPVKNLTGEAIRKALHTSPVKARVLRDTLRAERAATAAAAKAA
ncbi:conjugal transfer protein [Streptomyces sp. NPDC004111]|uniref:conjugal transfer protein n=1 Tax=Streptomyces sp. NPDC004111 TaxID=3364690 RepID=UPI0036A7DAAD